MAERRFCWSCGYPITVEEVMDEQSGRLIYTDGQTGAVIDECPGCGDSPLDLSRLLGEPNPLAQPYQAIGGDDT
jgi:hypothetical protein